MAGNNTLCIIIIYRKNIVEEAFFLRFNFTRELLEFFYLLGISVNVKFFVSLNYI